MRREVVEMAKTEPEELLTPGQLEVIGERLAERQETISRRKKAVRPTRNETSLQLLHRLFGDEVYTLFPDSLLKSVDDAYAFGKTQVDAYLVTEFPNEQEKLDAMGLIRAYCEIAPNGGYTMRIDWESEANVLHWRIIDRIKHNRSKDQEGDEGSV